MFEQILNWWQAVLAILAYLLGGLLWLFRIEKKTDQNAIAIQALNDQRDEDREMMREMRGDIKTLIARSGSN